MSDLDHEIRQGLRRLSEPTGRTEPLTFDRLAARRRQRRTRNAVLVVLPMIVMLVLNSGLMPFGSDDGTTVTADRDRNGSPPPQSSPTPEPTTAEGPQIDQDNAVAAESIVSAFFDDLRNGDLVAAAERWTGYPELGSDSPPEEKVHFIKRLLADPAITRILEGNTEAFVTASWGWTTADPVVTVLAPRDGDDPPVAVAFLAGFAQEKNEPEAMRIQRLPQRDGSPEPDVAGSFAKSGQQIEMPGVALEGGARAYINSREIAIGVDHVNLTMTITLPEDVEGDVAITVSTATPELPGAHAFALTIGSP